MRHNQRDAIIRNGKEGKQFVSMTVQTAIQGKEGQSGAVEISVSMDVTQKEAARLQSGIRVKVTGILIPKHRGDKTYFNLSAESIVPAERTTQTACGVNSYSAAR